MATDLPIHCACNSLRGFVRGARADRGNRCVCYCNDCQAFAHFLEQPDTILDAHGGTDIFQTSSARLEITQGKEHLACMRLSPKGLLRWYASCCKTPIGNTSPSGGLPFVGLIHSCMDPEAIGHSLDGILGPVRVRVHGLDAKGDRSKLDAHDKNASSMVLRLAPILLVARLRGDHKRSPFFEPSALQRAAEPRVLTPPERSAVEAARDAA